MNIDEIREDIICKKGIYYFDYTASGLGLKSVENELNFVLGTYANTHSECSKCAKITSDYYENARNGLKSLLGLGDDFYLFSCGFGSTQAIKKFQEILGIYIPPKTREILGINNANLSNLPLVIVSPYEHHSNEISYRAGLCEVRRISLENGTINWCELENTLKSAHANKRKIIISFSALSNVTGIRTDTARLADLGRRFGAIIALDASSLIAYENIPNERFDALFISSHKLLGGVGGSGILCLRKSLYTADEPTFAGGGAVDYVSKNTQIYAKSPERKEEAGTPGITQLIRAYLAFKFRNNFGLDEISRLEKQNLSYFESQMKNTPNFICYCPKNQARMPIIAFNIKGISPFELTKNLSEKYSIQVRAGCSCAGPYGHDLLGLDEVKSVNEFAQKPGWVRVSLHYTHTKDDLDYLISAIKSFCY